MKVLLYKLTVAALIKKLATSEGTQMPMPVFTTEPYPERDEFVSYRGRPNP